MFELSITQLTYRRLLWLTKGLLLTTLQITETKVKKKWRNWSLPRAQQDYLTRPHQRTITQIKSIHDGAPLHRKKRCKTSDGAPSHRKNSLKRRVNG